ncbi:hypothetical protein EZS27_025156 [termite gut metagenome]|uniref:DUF3408 domain-containing protein n=1 Tax=termite gut metagenome TaxID=433724 RepID=A0A5J4QWF1_9ZZZZ
MNTDKKQVTDIDVNAFIQNVAIVGINEEKPAAVSTDRQKDSQVEASEPTEEKPKEQARRKRGQATDYESLFLLRNEIRTRQGLYIGRDNYETLQMLVHCIRSERLSVSGLVNNIVRHHIETYEDEINRIYEENIRKPIKRKQ